jgi:hypothetical protein
VDDNQQVLDLVVRILRNGGEHEVLRAASPAEALQIGAEYHGIIHLLIADVVMPDMLGPEVAQRLRETRPMMRVILMSGDPAGNGARVLDAEGSWQFLGKPLSASVLKARVAAALSSSTPANGSL